MDVTIFEFQRAADEASSNYAEVIQRYRFSCIIVCIVAVFIGQSSNLFNSETPLNLVRLNPPTINAQMIRRRSAAAGHSGQYKTVSRSDIRLSNIARYSASLEFFVALPLPDLDK
jgi:predicted membrane GTPase involved in stress response